MQKKLVKSNIYQSHKLLGPAHTVPSHGKNLFFDFQIEAQFLVLMKEDMINF